MNKSESIIELSKAMVKFQGKIKTIKATDENPHFRHKYAGLGSIWDEIRVPLSECGLAVIQSPEVDGMNVMVITTLMHESGQFIENSLKIVSNDNRPQSIGSCITYGRRYSLASILGLSSEEDDDGNAAFGKQEGPGQKPPAKTQPPKQQQAKPPVQKPEEKKPVPPAPSENVIAEMANEQLKAWVKDGFLSTGDVSATIRLVAKRMAKLSELSKEQIEDIVRKCQKVVETKKKNDLTEGTDFDPTPVDPNAVPEDGQPADFYEEGQDGHQ